MGARKQSKREEGLESQHPLGGKPSNDLGSSYWALLPHQENRRLIIKPPASRSLGNSEDMNHSTALSGEGP